MRTGWIAAAITAAVTLGTLAAATREQSLGPNPVVVELFTSQGWSSCPPADRLVCELSNDAALRGKVIPLAFHVDYWDRLGWRDPFSSPEWSRRQAFYVRAMRLPSGYTPQMVVNGARQFTGSNAHALDAALAEESRQAPFGTVRVTATRDAVLHVAVNAKVTSPQPTDVVLAIVEDGVRTKVGAGENDGLTIDNDAIVRKLMRLGTGTTAMNVAITPDKSWNPSRLGVVVFLQDRKTLAIRGAGVARL